MTIGSEKHSNKRFTIASNFLTTSGVLTGSGALPTHEFLCLKLENCLRVYPRFRHRSRIDLHPWVLRACSANFQFGILMPVEPRFDGIAHLSRSNYVVYPLVWVDSSSRL